MAFLTENGLLDQARYNYISARYCEPIPGVTVVSIVLFFVSLDISLRMISLQTPKAVDEARFADSGLRIGQ